MKLRFGDRTANGYTKRMFVDPWSRYVPGQSGTMEHHQSRISDFAVVP